MLFEGFANWVVKHHKKIVVAWIIILLPSIYGMLNINQVVVYEEVGMGPSTTEAAIASRIIDEQFPSAIANSTVILVIQGKDVKTPAVRDFSMELEKNVKERAAAKKLEHFGQYTSIYTVYGQAIAGLVSTTAASIHQTDDGVNQTATLYYGMPANFLYVHNYTNGTASLMYGIPKFHKMMWDSLGSIPNVTQRDAEAYTSGLAMLSTFGAQGYQPEQLKLVFSYYNITCENWNKTRGDIKYTSNSTMRAQASVDDSLDGFIKLLGVGSVREAVGMINSIHENWTVSTWYLDLPPLMTEGNNLPKLDEFSNRTIYYNILAMMKSYSGTMPASKAAEFLGYHNSTMEYWGQNTSAFSSASKLTPVKMKSIMEGIIGRNAPEFINSTFASDPKNRAFSLGVLASFSIDSWNDTEKVHNYSMDLMVTSFYASGITFARAQLEEIYSMGSIPSENQTRAYAQNIVGTGTVDTYPMRLPPYVMANFISAKNDTMLIIIALTKGSDSDVAGLRSIVSETRAAKPPGPVTTYVTGDAALGADLSSEAFSDVEKIDPVTVGLIIGFIALFFMSIVTPFIPLMVMGIGIVVSQAILFLVGHFVAGIHYSVTILLFVMLLGAGCDYCIFIIARYREERREGRGREDSVRTSIIWAGESIATSGITVIIGFGALSVGSFSLMRTMGLVLAMAIAVALLIALTLLPSVILLLGNRIFWPSKIRGMVTGTNTKPGTGSTPSAGRAKSRKNGNAMFKSRKPKRSGYFRSAAKFSIRHAKAIVILAILVAVPSTYAVLNFQSSFDFIGAMPKTESTEGMKAMGEGFGQGTIMPTYVVVQFPNNIYDGNRFDKAALDSIDRFATDIKANVSGIEKVEASTISSGIRIDNETSWSSKTTAEKNETLQAGIGKEGRTVMLKVILKNEPFSKESMNSINSLRDLAKSEKKVIQKLGGAEIFVGGSTADLRDVQKVTDDDFQKMIIIVVIGIFIVLLIVLGSVLIPVRLIITISLSISWTLALTMVIFEYIRGIPLLWLMPMILFVVMMGLGMDYDIFLCTRMREEVSKGKSDEEAILTAVERTGGIITACGAIMAGALGSMMLSSMGLLQEFGFALFFAILIDATVVRIYLVPAIMVLLQKWNWWAPGRLQRVRLDEKKAEKMEKKRKKGKVKRRINRIAESAGKPKKKMTHKTITRKINKNA